MSGSPNGGSPGPPAPDNAVYVVEGPTHEQEIRALAIIAVVVIGLLAIIALLYTIRWVCLLMSIRREAESEESPEEAEAESSLHEDIEPVDEDVMSELASVSESAKRCYPSNEKMIELVLPKKTPETKKEGVTLGTLKPCPDYSQVAMQNEQMYIGGLSKRPKEPPRYISTSETPDTRKVGQPQATGESPALSTAKLPPKSQEIRSGGATTVLATTDQTPSGIVPQPTQLPLGEARLPSASAGVIPTPGPQSQLIPQSKPYTSGAMMIVGQSSARSASSTDGINAGARADTGVKITGATVSIKPMRRKAVRKSSREKRTVLPQPELAEVTTPPQTARAVSPVSSKTLSMTSRSSKRDAENLP